MIMTREEALKVAKPILFNTAMVKAIQDDLKTETRRVLKPQPYEECIAEGHKHEFVKDSDLGGEFTGFVCRKCGCGVCAPHGKYPVGTSWIRPKYKIGDILYVRETWQKIKYRRPAIAIPDDFKEEEYVYLADGEICNSDGSNFKWKPSIHMPKEAARIFLRVTDVRIEHLQDITEEQAIREGIARLFDDLPDAEYIDWTKRTGVYPKSKADWGYKNYLWHGNFGMYGTGNKLSDTWEYQGSAYDTAIDSFSSLWNTTVPLEDWNIYGWDANPWVGAFKFERLEVTR